MLETRSTHKRSYHDFELVRNSSEGGTEMFETLFYLHHSFFSSKFQAHFTLKGIFRTSAEA